MQQGDNIIVELSDAVRFLRLSTLRPSYTCIMSDVETAVQLELAKASQGKIPAGLLFEELVKNETLPVSKGVQSANVRILLTSPHSRSR